MLIHHLHCIPKSLLLARYFCSKPSEYSNKALICLVHYADSALKPHKDQPQNIILHLNERCGQGRI